MPTHNGDHYGDRHQPAATTAARPVLDYTLSDSRRYQLEIIDSAATSRALPAPTSGRAKRRRTSGSANDEKSSTKNTKNQPRGSFFLEPNPLLRLHYNDEGIRNPYLQNPHIFCTVRLMGYIEDQDRYVLTDQSILGGSQTQSLCIRYWSERPRSNAHARNNSNDTRVGIFVFRDLTVAAEGTYKLQFTLQEVQWFGENAQMTQLKVCESDPFEVVKSTAHVKRVPSSQEALACKEAGMKLSIRREPVKRKPKTDRWDVQSDPHLHIQQALVENPGCFEIVQGSLGRPRLLTTPLLVPGRQQYDPWTGMMPPDLNNTSSSMAYPSTMMPRTLPMAPFPGYGQYVGQKYPTNSDYTFQLNESNGEQGYGLLDGGAYITQATSAPTTQAYNALASVTNGTAYPPVSGCMAPGAFFGMSSGMPSNGIVSNGTVSNRAMSDGAVSNGTTSNDTTSNGTMSNEAVDSGNVSHATTIDGTMSNGYQQPHQLGDMSYTTTNGGAMSNGYQQHSQPGNMGHAMTSGGTMSNGYQ